MAVHNPLDFSGLIDSPYKYGTFDFEIRIAYVNNKVTLYFCSHKYQLGKVSAAGCTILSTSTLLMEVPLLK